METGDANAKQMKELFNLYDMKQHVDVPTHIKGHTLDLVITPNKDAFLKDLRVTEIDLSHHFLVNFNILAATSVIKEERKISYRGIKNVNMIEFIQDVKDGFSSLSPTLDLTAKVNNYNKILSEVVHKHTPMLTKSIK